MYLKNNKFEGLNNFKKFMYLNLILSKFIFIKNLNWMRCARKLNPILFSTQKFNFKNEYERKQHQLEWEVKPLSKCIKNRWKYINIHGYVYFQ